MEDFCLANEDRSVGEDLHRLIKGSGAFRRFKNAIYSMEADKAWHQFRRTEFERIAIEWLEKKEFPTLGMQLKSHTKRCDAFLMLR